MKPARTRFPPSPTGYQHVGNIRTALFDWLVARQSGGQFILRIEDTDKTREVKGAIEHVMNVLTWLGLDWDEGMGRGGPHGPYIQSERLNTYHEWGKKLIEKGRAYADPYSKEELEALREAAQKAKKPFLYRDHRPKNPPTWDGSQPLRFKSEPKAYKWHDAVMGDLSAGEEAVDDFILIKADGYPTYNFAHIIDDLYMECTHVIRGSEYVASTPRYLNLYEALAITPPILALVPHVMRPDGRKKLSKRDGAKDILDYAKEGYLPEALLNFMASMGWNDGTEQEIYSPEELIKKFSLDRVQKSGARFDEKRLLWICGMHMRNMSVDRLYTRIENWEVPGHGRVDFWPQSSKKYDKAYRKSALALVQDRLKLLSELPELTNFFFEDLPLNPSLWKDNKQLSKLDASQLKDLLQKAKAELEKSDFSTEDLTTRLNDLLESTSQKPVILFSLIRIATTQAPASPGLAETLATLGKETSMRRIDTMLASL